MARKQKKPDKPEELESVSVEVLGANKMIDGANAGRG